MLIFIIIYAECIHVLAALAIPFTNPLFSSVGDDGVLSFSTSFDVVCSFSSVIFSGTIYNSLVSGLRHYSRYISIHRFVWWHNVFYSMYRSTNAMRRYACLFPRVAWHLCIPSVGYHMNYWDVQYLIKPKVTQKTPKWTCIFYAHSINQPQNVLLRPSPNRDSRNEYKCIGDQNKVVGRTSHTHTHKHTQLTMRHRTSS